MAIPILLTGCSPSEISADTTKAVGDVVFNYLGAEWDAFWSEVSRGGVFADLVQWTMNLLNGVFKLVSNVVLFTPTILFDNEWFKGMIMKFALLSGSLCTVFTMTEGIKRMMNLSHTNMTQVLKRFPLALLVTSIAPMAFVKGTEWLNSSSQLILNMAFSQLDYNANASIENISQLSIGVFETGALFIYNILLIMFLIPILLYHGRRWFDLIYLGVMTPFAMISYIFDSLSGYHSQWWESLKELALVQLVYAVYISILAIILFAIPFPPTFWGFAVKLLVLLGGFWRLGNPPSFVTSYGDSGEDTVGVVSEFSKKIKESKNVKKLPSLVKAFFKKYI